MLDQATWIQSVLPAMGWRLGIRKAGENPYADMATDEKLRVEPIGIFPEKPLVPAREWDQIVEYFTKTAPKKLREPDKGPQQIIPADRFEVIPLFFQDKLVPRTSLLRYDALTRTLYIGDADKKLHLLDSSLMDAGAWQLAGPPSDICFPRMGPPRLLLVGSIEPTEKRNGALVALDSPDAQGSTPPFVGLARPVHVSLGDIDGNGTEDALICEFGHHTGQLTLYPDLNPADPRTLIERAGARQTILRDIDLDGKMDILVLMAQAEEQIILLRNLGEGRFARSILLRFSPLHGLSHFEFKDFDGDGDDDLLVSNGDNWDLSAIRKPYHGVRIFLNDRAFHFREAAFFALPGASKALAADFDGDGDLDIAAISFYDDPADPKEGFLLLENKGGMRFERYLLPEASSGKWLTMECADIDADGAEDVILGSYFHNPLEVTKLSAKGLTEFPQVLILKNRWKKHPGKR